MNDMADPKGLTARFRAAVAALEAMLDGPPSSVHADALAEQLGDLVPPSVTIAPADVRVIEGAIGLLLSRGWRGPAGTRSVHRLLYDLARRADYDDEVAERLLRHALELPASPLQQKLSVERLQRVRQSQEAGGWPRSNEGAR